MSDLRPQVLSGVWQCNRCHQKFRVRHVPGVLEPKPTSLPPRECRCGGQICAAGRPALVTEADMRKNAADSLIGGASDDE